MKRALILALGTALVTSGLALAQPARDKAAAAPADLSVAPPGWKAPRNAFGQPDLAGFWSNATLTPLTRNARLTPNPSITPAEATKLEEVFAKALAEANEATDPNATTEQVQAELSQSQLVQLRPDFAAAGGDVGGYNSFWLDPGVRLLRINGQYRTSILTTPNGQPPARKPGAPVAKGFGQYRDDYTSYETRSLGERCITSFGRNAGPPMLPNGYYNNGYQILQTPDSVVIVVEMIHDARIIRLNGKHRTDGIRPYMGDSVGRWEGDTLVVETVNIPESQNFMGSWKNLKVTERFTRISPTAIHYQFQIQDPDTWDQPWGGEYVFTPLNGQIYEYACHEGNYALPGILGGAREQEKEAASAAGSKPAPAARAAPGGS